MTSTELEYDFVKEISDALRVKFSRQYGDSYWQPAALGAMQAYFGFALRELYQANPERAELLAERIRNLNPKEEG